MVLAHVVATAPCSTSQTAYCLAVGTTTCSYRYKDSSFEVLRQAPTFKTTRCSPASSSCCCCCGCCRNSALQHLPNDILLGCWHHHLQLQLQSQQHAHHLFSKHSAADNHMFTIPAACLPSSTAFAVGVAATAPCSTSQTAYCLAVGTTTCSYSYKGSSTTCSIGKCSGSAAVCSASPPPPVDCTARVLPICVDTASGERLCLLFSR